MLAGSMAYLFDCRERCLHWPWRIGTLGVYTITVSEEIPKDRLFVLEGHPVCRRQKIILNASILSLL